MTELLRMKNIKSFLGGNLGYYQDKIFGLPLFMKEQVYYRLSLCAFSCIEVNQGACVVCSCPTIKKAYAEKSCNPDRFPDLMDKASWEEHKLEINIYDSIANTVRDVEKNILNKPY